MEQPLFKNVKNSILYDLDNARKEIKIAVAWFTNHEFYEKLINKLNEGIQVELVIIDDPINNREGGLDWQRYIKAGGNLYFSHYPKIMHHKFCIIDGGIFYNGSYNWTYSAEKINRENTIRHSDNEGLIKAFENEFEYLKGVNKRCKRVRKHSLEDLLKFQMDKAFRYYVSKELEASYKWLKKTHDFEMAGKVLSGMMQLGTTKERKKLEPQRVKMEELHDLDEKTRLFYKTVDQGLKEIERKKAGLSELSDHKKTNGKQEQGRLKKHADVISDLNQKEKLLILLKKETFQGDFGELRINLKWNTYDDLDLHVFDPSGNHIYYSNKEAVSKGSIGKLDVDANFGGNKSKSPQENVFWQTNPPSGDYKIIVKHFSIHEKEEVPFVLSIFSQKGKRKIIYGKVNHASFPSMLVAEIHYIRGRGITEIIEKKVETEI